MKTHKTAIGFLKHLSYIAKNQDMSDCKDWDKLTDEQQRMFYGILADIQNDLGEISNSLCETGFTKKPIY
jgi:hypothetical protein